MSDHIPHEVLTHILIKLPAKSVADFRLVSKSWYSLIMDPVFLSTYRESTMKQYNDEDNNDDDALIMINRYSIVDTERIFTLYRDDDSFHEYDHQQLDLPPHLIGIDFSVIGSCYGLYCFNTSTSISLKPLILWNPSIRVSATLPIEQINSSSNNSSYISRRVYGFGYSTDYKVVSIEYQLTYSIEIPIDVKVFTLNEGSWRSIKSTASPPYVIDGLRSSAFVNGAIHWIAHYNGSGDDSFSLDPRTWVVAAFDIGGEFFKSIDMPGGLMEEVERRGSKKELFIGVIGKSVSLMQYYTWNDADFHDGCYLWFMTEYGAAASWTKVFNIDLGCGIRNVVGCRRNGEMLVMKSSDGEVVSYDPLSQEVKRLGIYSNSEIFYADDDYMESLTLLK